MFEMKNKENIPLFFKGYNIAKETINLLKKEEGTKENLNDYLVQNQFSTEVFDRLTNPENLAAAKFAYDRNERFEEAKRLEQKMLKRAKVRRIRNFTITLSSAAAVAIVSLLVLMPQNNEEISRSLAVTTEVTVPTLITNDQTKIALNEEKIGKKIAVEVASKENQTMEVQYNTIVVPSRYTYTFMLSDSTKVTLNANSELRYPITFDGTQREVFLKGEAYFEVRKEEAPFIVRASEISVKVYGTQFNINTNGRDLIETLLVSGSVGVTVESDGSKEVMIKPSELFTLNTSTGKVTTETVDCESYLAWKNELFLSENESLSSLLDKIALWYGVEFRYDRSKIENITIGYTQLKRSLEIDNILKGLEVMTGVKFIKEENGKYAIE